jgi:uncharacterized membrane protein
VSRWSRILLLGLAGVVVVHLATVRLLPRVVMGIATAGMARVSGFNAAVFPPRADSAARTIVRPSPDLLYAGCAFDVRQHPLRIRAEVPRDTYWSLSMFAANTDNFFVVNDRQATSGVIDVVLARAGSEVALPDGAQLVEAPSWRGIVLTRTLVTSEERLPEIDQARRRFSCTPLA